MWDRRHDGLPPLLHKTPHLLLSLTWLAAAVLTTPALFRPKLQLAEGGEGLVHVRLHMEDLTAEPSIRCLGILARAHEWYGALLGPDQLEQLVPLLQVSE